MSDLDTVDLRRAAVVADRLTEHLLAGREREARETFHKLAALLEEGES